MPMLPSPEEDDEVVAVNIRMPRSKWEALEEIAKYQTDLYTKAGRTRTFSRNEVVEYLCRWGIEQFWQEQGGRPKPKK